MACSRRLRKELTDLKNCHLTSYEVLPDEQNLLRWNLWVSPEAAPFNNGSFQVEVIFPPEYPFRPPNLKFSTKIYHPNIDESGLVCLPIVSPDNWKPNIQFKQVISDLIKLINYPDVQHALRADLAKEFQEDLKSFMKNASEYTKKFGEKRRALPPKQAKKRKYAEQDTSTN